MRMPPCRVTRVSASSEVQSAAPGPPTLTGNLQKIICESKNICESKKISLHQKVSVNKKISLNQQKTSVNQIKVSSEPTS